MWLIILCGRTQNIIVNEQLQSITQGINSQCITFNINRYRDGVDLKDMIFNIHFVNAKDKEGVSIPVNFGYSDTKFVLVGRWIVA